MEDIEELAVIAFVQDRDQGQVLQVASDYLSPLVGKAGVEVETRSMAVYPNPATDRLYANLGNRFVNQGALKIMDISGQEVLSMDVQPGESLYQFDVSRLSRGVYILYWTEESRIRGHEILVLIR